MNLFMLNGFYITPGSSHENTTNFTACSCKRDFLPLIVIFTWEHVQTTRKPQIPSDHQTTSNKFKPTAVTQWTAQPFSSGLDNLKKKLHNLRR